MEAITPHCFQHRNIQRLQRGYTCKCPVTHCFGLCQMHCFQFGAVFKGITAYADYFGERHLGDIGHVGKGIRSNRNRAGVGDRPFNIAVQKVFIQHADIPELRITVGIPGDVLRKRTPSCELVVGRIRLRCVRRGLPVVINTAAIRHIALGLDHPISDIVLDGICSYRCRKDSIQIAVFHHIRLRRGISFTVNLSRPPIKGITVLSR